MWFTSVFMKTLREFRWALIGWGLGMGLLMMLVLMAYPSLVTTPAAKASLISVGQSFAWLAAPVRLDTAGGYVMYKYGLLLELISIWSLLACSRILRGEEERGSLDVLLAQPRSRRRVALEKLAAFWTAQALIALIIALLAYAGGVEVNAGYGLGDALILGLDVVLLCGFFGSLALFISQFSVDRGVATGLTGALLVVFIVLDMIHRGFPNTDWISQLSPVYYFNVNKPLIPDFSPNYGALLVLLGLNVVFGGFGFWLFLRRDVGGIVRLPAFLRQLARPANPARALPLKSWSFRSLYARGLAMALRPTLWWTLGIAGLAAFMVEIAVQTQTNLKTLYDSSPVLKAMFESSGGGSSDFVATILSTLFIFMPVLLMAFATTQASRWTGDEEDGRQDLILATPHSRLNVLLARFGALTTSTVFIGLVTMAATSLTAMAAGVSLDQGKLIAATLSIIPLGLLMAALGYLLGGWLRTAIETGLLSFLLVIWFFLSFVGPGLNLPENTLRLSPFYYYGNPILDGLPIWNMLGLLAVALLALALAAWRFTRKDIAR
jgi:ABC-2 type transport system permease protein